MMDTRAGQQALKQSPLLLAMVIHRVAVRIAKVAKGLS